MERDAPVASAVRFEDLIPPPDVGATQRVGLVGFVLVALSAILGVVSASVGADAPWMLSTLRLWLVGLGMGLIIMVIAVFVELRREQLRARTREWSETLETWE